MEKKATLHVHHAFLYVSLPLLHGYRTTWKCLISRLLEDASTRQRLSFSIPELRCRSFLIQLRRKNANNWRIARGATSAIKFEAARIHFSNDVSVAAAVVVDGKQHSVACCSHSKQCRNNVATRCCAKNRRCESSSVISLKLPVLINSQDENKTLTY